jgi:hypothetical protein
MAVETFWGLVDSFGMVFEARPEDLEMWNRARISGINPSCGCLGNRSGNLRLHSDVQDTGCEGWIKLLELVETAASKGKTEFSPGLELSPELWRQIVTLPPSISKLESVKKLYLYGSHLVRIPPEICEMANLEELDLYTSYRLHWLPYEVTRCQKLKKSRISTRALYGNYKHRSPFPRLNIPEFKLNLPSNCSVCQNPLQAGGVQQMWITVLVATDVLPLLVNACSLECVQRLPAPAYGYVDHPHAGGLDVKQPPVGVLPPNPARKWTRAAFLTSEVW